jgi:hypothetical protein
MKESAPAAAETTFNVVEIARSPSAWVLTQSATPPVIRDRRPGTWYGASLTARTRAAAPSPACSWRCWTARARLTAAW